MNGAQRSNKEKEQDKTRYNRIPWVIRTSRSGLFPDFARPFTTQMLTRTAFWMLVLFRVRSNSCTSALDGRSGSITTGWKLAWDESADMIKSKRGLLCSGSSERGRYCCGLRSAGIWEVATPGLGVDSCLIQGKAQSAELAVFVRPNRNAIHPSRALLAPKAS